MARASKSTVVIAEYTLVLTNEEAHELAFYLLQRGRDYKSSRGVTVTDNIHSALKVVLN